MSRATVNVGLGDRAYEVLVGPGLIDGAGGLIAPLLKRKRVAVVTDNVVGDYHGERLAFALERGGVSVDTIVVPAGEETKSFAGLERLSAQLLALKLDRGDMIVAFGGIDFIQIPTTLLAQVDSSVGGKTAIDTPAGKNLVGAFHQPRLVLADLDVLCTLPDREMACGYAEVVKYGLLGDRAFFDWLETHGAQVLKRRNAELTHAVARSVQMKAEIVAEDEREVGRRALLNLGHTFGHALESETGFGDALKHGEAVAAGCAQAFRFSAQLGLCPPADADRAEKVFRDANLPTRLEHLPRQGLNADALIDHMAQDKKAISGRLTFILARSIGDAIVSRDVDAATVRDFLVSEGAST
jgi:3-dehydroquinate synthase